MVQNVDARLREATIAVLHERGWDGLTLERVAEVSGRARSTLWRQGLTREALCELADRHLPLLLATDEAFHQHTAPGQPPDYLWPFIAFLRDGVADGSLAPVEDVAETADVVFNTVAWPYVHLRGRHGWPAD